jgi:hypothetical protein
MNVIAPPKSHKTYAVMDLAATVAIGGMWLGQFQTEPGNVLMIDNELHGETIASRLPKIADARGLQGERRDQFLDRLSVQSLRGKLKSIVEMGSYFAGIQPGQFQVIILDALYRFLPADIEENSNGGMASIYNFIDKIADRLGCCFVLVHHASKGLQNAKSVTDVGAGAGSQSRATDCHLVLRQHEEDGIMAVDAAVRSWKPIEPFCIRWDYPVWNLAPEFDPQHLKKPKSNRAAKAPVAPKEPAIAWTPAMFVETFIESTSKTWASIVTSAAVAGLSERKVKLLCDSAVDAGLIHKWMPKKRTDPARYSTQEQPLIEIPPCKKA